MKRVLIVLTTALLMLIISGCVEEEPEITETVVENLEVVEQYAQSVRIEFDLELKDGEVVLIRAINEVGQYFDGVTVLGEHPNGIFSTGHCAGIIGFLSRREPYTIEVYLADEENVYIKTLASTIYTLE